MNEVTQLNKIKILIADDIEETRSLLKQVLTLDNEHFDIVGEASNGAEAVSLCGKLKPDIILMDVNMPIKNGLEATEEITNLYPQTSVIIMSVQSETEYLKTAMVAGAKGYVLKPINHEEISELIQKTYDKYKDIRPQKQEKKREGKLISFYSFKGGVGKSILALNSSVILSNKLKKKVLLIDMDLHFGDISLLTNKHLEKTILDLIDDDAMDSYESVSNYFYNYSDNLDILFAPLSPEGAEYVSRSSIESIIELVRDEYDYIVFDTGVNFNEHTLFALDIADTIYFVSSMEMTSIKNSKLGLGVMKSLNYDDDKVKIIINIASEKFGISKRDIEKVFDRPIETYIAEESKYIRLSVNRGQALADDSKGRSTKFYKSLFKLCKEF